MPSLQEVIAKRLAEATQQLEESSKKEVVLNAPDDSEEKGTDKVDLAPKKKEEKAAVKEDTASEVVAPVAEEKATESTPEQKSSVSTQVSALLEAEGLSEEFRLQAVTIFEAAVTDRVLQIEEELRKDFDVQLNKAITEMNDDIDEFLSEAVETWQKDNEVAIRANFNTQVAESFMDGLSKLIAEHNIEVPEGKEDALESALSKVEALQEEADAKDQSVQALQEQVKSLEGKQVLESFRQKMTQVEFDRFVQLTESIKYDTKDQYEKQLAIVLENFGAAKKVAAPVSVTAPIVESTVVTQPAATVVESVSNPQMARYVSALKSTKR